MTIEERLEQAEKLVAEVKAELAAKAAPRRNWPEKVEAGMVFSEPNGSANAWFAAGIGFACISGSCLGMWRETLPDDCHYIGKDCIQIRTDAHEPTGAELVGEVCEFSDDGKEWHFTDGRECNGYSESEGYSWGMQGRWWQYARPVSRAR